MAASEEKTPQLEKVCGVVVTYFPPHGVQSRLEKIAKHVDRLIVIDNSASDNVSALLAAVAGTTGAELLLNSYNVGIAKALNQGVDFARVNGAAWVVFFDQDSEPNDEFRSEFDHIRSVYDEGKPLGVIGSNYFLSGHAAARYPTESPDGKKYTAITSVITSGSSYAMTMLARLGPFKDEYFIDCVDTEYCWRARTNGYAVCITTRPLVTHTIGAPTESQRAWPENDNVEPLGLQTIFHRSQQYPAVSGIFLSSAVRLLRLARIRFENSDENMRCRAGAAEETVLSPSWHLARNAETRGR